MSPLAWQRAERDAFWHSRLTMIIIGTCIPYKKTSKSSINQTDRKNKQTNKQGKRGRMTQSRKSLDPQAEDERMNDKPKGMQTEEESVNELMVDGSIGG